MLLQVRNKVRQEYGGWSSTQTSYGQECFLLKSDLGPKQKKKKIEMKRQTSGQKVRQAGS